MVELWPFYGTIRNSYDGVVGDGSGGNQFDFQSAFRIRSVYSEVVAGQYIFQVLRDFHLVDKEMITGSHLHLVGEDDWNTQIQYERAMLVLMDMSKKVLDAKILDTPIAKASNSKLKGPSEIVQVEVDYSIGMGSYNGPVTYFVYAKNGKIEFLKAEDSEEGSFNEIGLMNSLKTQWGFIDSENIVLISCRPNIAGGGLPSNEINFEVRYSRYYWAQGKWNVVTKAEPGFWEMDGKLPPLRQFPVVRT